MKNDKIETAFSKVEEQHERLKKENFTGEIVYTIKFIYNQGGIRTEEVVLAQKV